MDLKESVEGIGFARQQRFKLATGGFRLQFGKDLFGLGNDRLILLGFAELDHADLILELLLDTADRLELVLERIALLHHPGCALRIVPQRGILCELIQFSEAGIGRIEVKDASSAARPTA